MSIANSSPHELCCLIFLSQSDTDLLCLEGTSQSEHNSPTEGHVSDGTVRHYTFVCMTVWCMQCNCMYDVQTSTWGKQ